MARRKNRFLFWMCLGLGAVSLTVGTWLAVGFHSLFDPVTFGNRLGESLDDPAVADYTASKLTDAIILSNADLVAARPLVLMTVHGMIQTRAFHALAATAGARAHQAAFSKGAREVVLSLPDLQVLLRSALAQANPQLAAKVPKQLEAVVGKLSGGKSTQLIIDAWRFGVRMKWIERALRFAGPVLLLLALWFAPTLRIGFFRVGMALAMSGLAVMGMVPLAGLSARLMFADKALGLAAGGVAKTFLSENWTWGLFLAGLGVLICAGAASLLETVDVRRRLQDSGRWLVTPPQTRAMRWLWAGMLLALGIPALLFPLEMARGILFLAGGLAAYVAVREFFRLVMEAVDEAAAVSTFSAERRWAVHVVLVVILGAGAGAGWYFWRDPSVRAATPAQRACNGMVELCDKRLDQVVFPGTHNSMSNEQAAGWMFPHQQKDILGQLRDGIRALLLDIHYGFAGGTRIKTDLTAGQSRDRLIQALGQEGFDAAMRIRGRLVGVDEQKRELYFCHGFCEIGAYPVGPTLEQIRDFLIENPDEVVIMIVEDYVTPLDLAAAFDRAQLTPLVYHGPAGPPWPTLGELIGKGGRLVMFTESGRPGVPWLHPAFESFQETPYSFHSVEEMSCAPNRGGTSGSLFLLNNWIETTPAPKPSNAAIVNAHDALLRRARKCQAQRRHLPNIIAVDFYGTGDVIGVAREMNRAQVKISDATAQPALQAGNRTPADTAATP